MKNSTIVVNHPTDGSFGCKKRCTYCNWKVSPFLPTGRHDWGRMEQFISSSESEFITISGGGDPLYQIFDPSNVYDYNLTKIIQLITKHKKKIRIITREILTAQIVEREYSGIIHWSFSLDAESMRKFVARRNEFKHAQVSLVMPCDTLSNINEHYVPWVKEVQAEAQCEIVLREDLNSLFDIDWLELKSLPGVKYVPRELCLGSDYFIDSQVFSGYTITPPRRSIFKNVLLRGGALFGGALRHIESPRVHDVYGDMDIATSRSSDVIEYLKEKDFKVTYHEEVVEGSYDVWLLEHKNDKDFVYHVHQVESIAEFIGSFQLDVDDAYMDIHGLKTGMYVDHWHSAVGNKTATQIRERSINPEIEKKYFHRLKWPHKWTLNLLDTPERRVTALQDI
jgi:hypothetical protein